MDFLHYFLHQAAHHAAEEYKKNGGCGCVTILLFAIAGLIAYLVF